MKRFLAMIPLWLAVVAATAIPAKRGIWKTLTLDGKPVSAQLMGDEHAHYWMTDDGQCLTERDGRFVVADMERLRSHALARRMKADGKRRVRRNAIGDFMHYSGQKKGLIILVEFADMQFWPSNDSLLYTRICNEPGFSEGNFRGSVNDYFKAQSYGEFDLTFDVAGPVVMPHSYQYYGYDAGDPGDDIRPGEMVATACQAVDAQVDFADYDWDGDGIVDQVMCIYAGQGQADGGSADTIWPHEWQLEESDFGSTLTLDDVVINTYAVANERSYYSVEGIGTICHEFSHCLGLPDMYDTSPQGKNYGMSQWSIMDQGSYNGNSFCPAGYSSFDRYTCGWAAPAELKTNTTIEGMRALEEAPDVYMVRNEAYPDEYYLLENRQPIGWDAELPGAGMLILHVDFDREIWEYNIVNAFMTKDNEYGNPPNDHQRCTPFHANNTSSSYRDEGVPYPYLGNDSLTNTSSPAATLYHENRDGRLLMNKGILDIKRHDDGTMSFRFRNTATDVYIPEGTVFYESFNNCNGSGGNDGIWNATIASSNLQTDNEGWTTTKGYGGYMCARFGNALTAGQATTPPFETATGEALVSFKAAGWGTDGTTLSLSIQGEGGATVEPGQLTLEPFAWKAYTVKVKGHGPLRLTFAPEKRFLLDEVQALQVKSDTPDAIATTAATAQGTPGFYTTDGRRAGTSLATLPRGIYIMRSADGQQSRKIIK